MSFAPPTPTAAEQLLSSLQLEKTSQEGAIAVIQQRLRDFTFYYNQIDGYVLLYETYLLTQGYNLSTRVQDPTMLVEQQRVDEVLGRIANLRNLGRSYTEKSRLDRWEALDLRVVIMGLEEEIRHVEPEVLMIQQNRVEMNNLVEALARALGKTSIQGATGPFQPLQEQVVVEGLYRRLFDPSVEIMIRQFENLMI